uniref:Uncharacterized protein n=1 Tax=Vertebrata thuyoides TaxID=2006970 RepID=A0A1Z1MB09_9FLOR|nr:hypothetical protein [Vertebrata thuyoides]ARW63062.1 hypothetical protein [Vertebrata thuyoides]
MLKLFYLICTFYKNICNTIKITVLHIYLYYFYLFIVNFFIN